MLVLTRKAKQQIQIGPNITITILQVKGQAVRVGIEAPKNVNVLRTELAQKMVGRSVEATEMTVDPTVLAALEKIERESAISSDNDNEQVSGRTTMAAGGSMRCRAPRADVAPLSSSYPTTGPASFIRPRRHRLMMK